MNEKISLDYSFTYPFLNDKDFTGYQEDVLKAMNVLENGTGDGSDFLGWLTLPEEMLSSDEFKAILEVGSQIFEDADLMVCVGIGGSYLGAKAVIEALQSPLNNIKSKEERSGPKMVFAGQNISGLWLQAVLKEIENSNSVYINVISKSGTTTEPGIAFRNIKSLMEKKYGKINASKRIIATTDGEKGALKKLAANESYTTFVIPDNVGGRFSVLTPVGLVPIAASGIDITKLLQGALEASKIGKNENLMENPAASYAMARNLLLKKGYHTEIMVNYEPVLHDLGEWWKQLFGESEGKKGRGIFPAAVDFTTDLHSMGQWIQDGQRFIFETILNIEKPLSTCTIVSDPSDLDGLEYLAGKTFAQVNQMALTGTRVAHYEGQVPNMLVSIPELTEYFLGQLLYIFEQSCGISGYLLGINPFDQPGVESYKKNMFALLDKPGEENQNNKQFLEDKLKQLPQGKKTY